jgi:hypothetical protein
LVRTQYFVSTAGLTLTLQVIPQMRRYVIVSQRNACIRHDISEFVTVNDLLATAFASVLFYKETGTVVQKDGTTCMLSTW